MANPHGQENISRLLLLPAELRLQIYGHLFFSTRLTHRDRKIIRISSRGGKPEPDSLAILCSCRLIRCEIGDSWISQVLFAFECVDELLDKFSSVPKAVLGQIRRIRVGSGLLMLTKRYTEFSNFLYYTLAWALKLLPGLYLDTLTVIDSGGPNHALGTLDSLVKHGDGWRELHYFTRCSPMLYSSTWSTDLAWRDGVNSGACVRMYGFDLPSSVVNHSTREIFEQQLLSTECLETSGVDEDAQLKRPGGFGRQFLVIVRRGKHANILEDATVPLHENDIRQWSGSMTWEEIKRVYG